MPRDYPACKWCGHVFRFQVGLYKPNDRSYINLQEQWNYAHEAVGEHTKTVTCPECGNQCEIGYKCTMRAVSRKAKGGAR